MGKVQQRAGGAGKKLILSMVWIYSVNWSASTQYFSSWNYGSTSRGDIFISAGDNAEYDFAKFSYNKNGYITTIEFKKTFKVFANVVQKPGVCMKINGNDVKAGDTITPNDTVTVSFEANLGNLVLLEEV